MDLSILIPLMLLAFGFAMAAAVTGRRETGGLERVLASLAWGPGLVTGIVSLTTFFGLAVGPGHLGRGELIAVLIVLTASMWLGAGLLGQARSVHSVVGDRRSVGPVVLWLVPVVFVGGYGWTFLRFLTDRPLGSFDAMGIWTFRALQWYRAGDAFPDTVRLLVESKPGYPLFLPGLITSQFSIWGGESVVIPVVTGGLFAIGLGAMLALAVLRDASPAVAVSAAALVLSTPMVWCGAYSQEADFPLAYLTLCAAFGLTELIRGDRSSTVPPWLAGFFLGLLVWTKNEGLILAGVLLTAAGVTLLLSRGGAECRGDRRQLSAGLALGALPGVLATVIFKITWVPTGEAQRFLSEGFFERLAEPSRWVEVGSAFGMRLIPGFGLGIWGASVVVLTCLSVLVVVRGGFAGSARAGTVYCGTAAVATAVFLAVYLITPDPLEWHLRNSLDRLLLQVFPLAVVGLTVWASTALKNNLR